MAVRVQQQLAALGLSIVLLALPACTAKPLDEQAASQPRPETIAEPPDGLDDAGAEAWEQWRASGMDSYRYRLDVACFCRTVHGPVEVRDDQVVAVGNRQYPTSVSVYGVTGFDGVEPTIDGLFTQLAEAMERADRVRVRYDGDTGVPIRINVDWIDNAIDDEIVYTATHLQPALTQGSANS